MKRLVLVFGILVDVVSVSMGAMSEEEWHRHNCFKNNDKSSCQKAGLPIIGNMTNNDIDELMMNGYSCINKEDKNACKVVFDKIQKGYGLQYCNGKICLQVAFMYEYVGDFFKANKYFEVLCHKWNGAEGCFFLGFSYVKGQGVRQNLSTAKQYYGKACDFGNQAGCDSYKLLHNQGVQ